MFLRMSLFTVLCIIAACVFTTQVMAVKPSKSEINMRRQWVVNNLSEKAADVPFSFIYGDKNSRELLKSWGVERTKARLDKNRVQETTIYTDPKTKLQVRVVSVEYIDFPTIEWTVYLKNTGSVDTPIIKSLQGLDTIIGRGDGNEFLLHHFLGSVISIADYAPQETKLTKDASKRITTRGGRPTDSDWAYFNLEWCDQGVIIAVGWPGQWAAEFNRTGDKGLNIKAGQETTNFKLHPGEEVRTPLIAMQFWQDGNWIDAQNIWRRWMMAHNMPQENGKPIQPFVSAVNSDQIMPVATTEQEIFFINRYAEEKMKFDYWWMDAGWYQCNADWTVTGTWEVDKKRFPNGLREICEHAHAQGIKTIVWFEPERVHGGTWLTENHPDWILGGKDGGLLNMGNPDAWNWVVNHIDKIITEEKIDMYRQDFNIAPLGYWLSNDAPDRKGITENKHIVGYLAYWDELLKRHPGMLIDSCASGGKRNDLETMRRSIPIWRTDYCYEANSGQCHSYGLGFWLPFSGAGLLQVDEYTFRSNAVPTFAMHYDMRAKDVNYDNDRRRLAQWRQYSPNFMGDYYPLTEYSQNMDVWMAWQFDTPEKGEGMVQAFRRPENNDASKRLKLFGLNAKAQYNVTNIDSNVTQKISGADLMTKGLLVDIPNKREAVVYLYKKI